MKKVLQYIAFVAAALQLMVIFFSWMIAAAWPELPIRSLLSNEGIRWFFGSFTDNQQTVVLVWLALGSVAWGVFRRSGLAGTLRRLARGYLPIFRSAGSVRPELHYRQKVGLVLVGIIAIVFAVVMGLLTLVPHAILLSVVGKLFPSSFSVSIIPVGLFFVLSTSAAYGYSVRSFPTLSSLYEAMVSGAKKAAYIIPAYIFVSQLWASIRFVVMG